MADKTAQTIYIDADPSTVMDVIADIGLRVFTMEEIDRRGIYDVSRDAIRIASRGTEGIHVSFDVDVIDPTVAPGVGTPVRGGLTYRETHTLMRPSPSPDIWFRWKWPK